MKYEIKNWSEFQQYKDDRPMHWIKLHNSLLDDFRFNQLPEITQYNLVRLWLVASKNGGKIEGNAEWLAKLINTKKLDLDLLVREGFIVRTESYGEQFPSKESVPREEKRREEEIREEEEENRGNNLVELKPDYVREVFEYWQSVMSHPKAALDEKRKALIKRQLKSYDSIDLKKAIYGCSVTPYNMGENDRGEKYDSIELILRDAAHIDRFMKNADNPPTGKVKTIEQTQREASAQASRVGKFLFGDSYEAN